MERTQLPESNWRTHPARILRTRQMTEHEKLFEIALGGGRTLDYEPGQFVMLSLFGVGEIPISVASSPTQRASFEICVRAVGKVTRALHRLEAGDELGVRGPYGHGFPIRILEGNDLLIIAGGENFRETRGSRQRHRHFRKFAYPFGKFHRFFCTGCGRCTRTCMAGIKLKETLTALAWGQGG